MTIKECKQVGIILIVTLVISFFAFSYGSEKKNSVVEAKAAQQLEEGREETNSNNTLEQGLVATCLSLMFSVSWGLYLKYSKKK